MLGLPSPPRGITVDLSKGDLEVCCTNVSLSKPSLEGGAFDLEVDVILGAICRCLALLNQV